MFKEIVSLVSYVDGTNEMGDPIKVPTLREVFANRLSIKQSEFYQAMSVGMRPEITFEVRIIDYTQENLLNYKGKPYTIIRTYEKQNEFIELVCQGLVNGVI